MTTTDIATKTRQKAQRRRAAGKTPTATKRSSRHDYTKLIGVKVRNPVELIEHIEQGLEFAAVEALQKQMGLATKEMARLLDIKFRTLLRREEAGRVRARGFMVAAGTPPASDWCTPQVLNRWRHLNSLCTSRIPQFYPLSRFVPLILMIHWLS